MLTKLKALREEREEGFTLIELLVVILIIGILAAIAIPVFLNQRQTANDGAVESDVRNATSAVENWIVGEKGKKTTITQTIADGFGVKKSGEVTMTIKGDANNYCIEAFHSNGKKYVAATKATYDNATGGLNKPCSGTTTSATAVNL